ncbi:MAG: mandelate racemase/muconate lactonizing enzyme family protein [Tranquillimonas sp.]
MPRIARITAWSCRSPIERPVATSFGVMKDRPAVFLRVEDGDGAAGWGEIFANWPAAGAEHRVNLLADDLAPLLIGRDCAAPDALFRDLEEATRIRALQCGEFGPFRQVLAGLDQALWDMVARRAGLPLGMRLNDKAAAEIPAYASGIHIDAAAQAIPAARAAGFTAFKVKVGFDLVRDADKLRDVATDLRDGERLFADANQAWSVDQAARFLAGVADLGLGWMEEPIAADSAAEDWLRLRGGVPLAGGENLAGHAEFDAAIGLGALEYVQPDLAKWGGVTGCLAVARQALAAGRVYCPHFLGGGVGLAASAHLLAAAGGPGLLEVDVNPNPLRDAFDAVRDRVSAGRWRLDPAPGLGLSGLPSDIRRFVTLSREIA